MAKFGTDAYQDEVRACSAEIDGRLRMLTARHSPLVVLVALSEHVGGALRLCQETGVCTPAEALDVLGSLEETTFADGTGCADKGRRGPA